MGCNQWKHLAQKIFQYKITKCVFYQVTRNTLFAKMNKNYAKTRLILGQTIGGGG